MRRCTRRARAGAFSRILGTETAAVIYREIVVIPCTDSVGISAQYPLALFDELFRGNARCGLTESDFLVLTIEQLLDLAGSGWRWRRQRRYLVGDERNVVDHRATDFIEVRREQLANGG